MTSASAKKTRKSKEGSPGRGFLRLAMVIYAVTVVYSLAHWLSQPVRNWDMLGYVGCIVAMDTDDPKEIRARTLEEIRPVVWPELYIEYADKNHLSNNDDNFYRQLPFYRIKPLYVGAVWLFHKMGAGLAASTWLVSAFSFAAIAALLSWWRPRDANRGVWLLGISALMMLGYLPLGTFAGYSVPDPLSLAFFLVALLGWMRKRSLPLYAAGSLLCVLARPDALIQVFFMTVYFALFAEKRHRLTRVQAGIAVAIYMAGYIGIRLGLGSGGWSVLFYRAFIDEALMNVNQSEIHITLAQYFAAFWAGVKRELVDPRLITLFLVSGGALVAAWRQEVAVRRHWVWMLAFTWAAFGARFLLFPGSDERYFYSFYVMMIMASCELYAPIFTQVMEKKHPLSAALKWIVRDWGS
jgi:hypothetical protein